MFANLLKLRVDRVLGFLVVAQIAIYILYLKFNHYFFLGAYFLTAIPMIISMWNARINKIFLLGLIIVLSLFLFFSFLSNTYPYYVNMYNLLYGIISLIGAYTLFRVSHAEKYIKFVFWLYTALVYFYIVKFGFGNPDLYNEVFSGSSRNYVSATYIMILVLLATAYEKSKSIVPLIYPLITLIACVFLFGRSGILLSLAITFLILIKQKNHYVTGFLVLIIASMVAIKFNQISDFVLSKTNFSTGVDSLRSNVIGEYLHQITYSNSDILLGRRISSCCTWITLLDGNPHNSFIMGHIRYGIIHIIFSLCILIYIFLSRNLTFIFFGLIIFGRMFVDQIGLFTGFDIVLYYLMFVIYGYKNKKMIA